MPRVRCRYHVQCSNRHVCACLWAGLFCDRRRLGSAFLDNDGDSSSESDDEVDAHYTLSTIRLKRNVSYKSADFEPGFTEYTKCILRRMFSCFDADADSAWNYAEARSFFSAVSTAELLEFDVVCGDDGAYRLSLWAQKFQTDIVGNLTFEGSGSSRAILGTGGGVGMEGITVNLHLTCACAALHACCCPMAAPSRIPATHHRDVGRRPADGRVREFRVRDSPRGGVGEVQGPASVRCPPLH